MSSHTYKLKARAVLLYIRGWGILLPFAFVQAFLRSVRNPPQRVSSEESVDSSSLSNSSSVIIRAGGTPLLLFLIIVATVLPVGLLMLAGLWIFDTPLIFDFETYFY